MCYSCKHNLICPKHLSPVDEDSPNKNVKDDILDSSSSNRSIKADSCSSAMKSNRGKPPK